MTKWFKTNLRLKLASLLLAIVVWFFIKALITEPTSRVAQPQASVFRYLGFGKPPGPAPAKVEPSNTIHRAVR
ncbi:MAG: hypothetical protein N3B01_00105 [Verrucomicrobiae bacterium]|nr:hypothetical protein [Verrucomicrobiae bacterium]